MRLIIFGGSGDLMATYLGPALLELEAAGKLPGEFSVIGTSREDWSNDDFRAHTSRDFPEGPEQDGASRRLCDRLSFERSDASNIHDVRRLVEASSDPIVAYLALPPAVAADALEALAKVGLPDGSRVALEKPFGEDLMSARALNERIRRCFHEDIVFRVDHFLGMQAVRNILPLRLANPLLLGAWSARDVERVEIAWEETNTLQGRAGYFDGVGVLKDMVQNHLLEVLCLLAMEPPESLHPCDVRAARANVLRAIPTLSPREAAECSVRARYTTGSGEGGRIRAYAEEDGVDPALNTETFVELVLRVENERWSGVPFVIRTGKALARDRRHVDVIFGSPRCRLYPEALPNRIRLGLERETLGVGLQLLADGLDGQLRSTELRKASNSAPVAPYANVLRSILSGDAATSVGAEESEEAWRAVEPFLSAWREGAPLLEYPAGTGGPDFRRLPSTAAAHSRPHGDDDHAASPTH
jgi:glucose-6-phosphate 1-dehydrogenase